MKGILFNTSCDYRRYKKIRLFVLLARCIKLFRTAQQNEKKTQTHWETPKQILVSATHPPVSGNYLSGQDTWLLSVLQKTGMFLAKIQSQVPVSVQTVAVMGLSIGYCQRKDTEGSSIWLEVTRADWLDSNTSTSSPSLAPVQRFLELKQFHGWV